MKHWFDFPNIYNVFQVYVKTQHSIVTKCSRCDLGGDYTSNHHTFCTYTPNQNNVVERKHRHIVETTCSLLLSTFVPTKF